MLFQSRLCHFQLLTERKGFMERSPEYSGPLWMLKSNASVITSTVVTPRNLAFHYLHRWRPNTSYATVSNVVSAGEVLDDNWSMSKSRNQVFVCWFNVVSVTAYFPLHIRRPNASYAFNPLHSMGSEHLHFNAVGACGMPRMLIQPRICNFQLHTSLTKIIGILARMFRSSLHGNQNVVMHAFLLDQ